MLTPFLILLNHFFADFILQSSKMATRKSTSNKWLTIHVLTYIGGMMPTAIYMDYTLNHGWVYLGNGGGLWWLLINFPLHWITDYLTSRWTGHLYKRHLESEERIRIYGYPNQKFLGETWMHWFFCVIGADQYLFHIPCLLFTYQYFMQ